jgi:PAS domain S-box-containing protein
MSKPTYEELEREVEQLRQTADGKVCCNKQAPGIQDLVFFRINRNWRFEFVDERILDITGYTADEFVKGEINWLDVVHEQDKQAVQQELERALASDSYYLSTYRILRRDGGNGWVKMRGPLHRDGDNEFSSMYGVIDDVSYVKTMEDVLESEHEVFGWVANHCEDGIYVVSEDYRIKFMNKALIDLVGDHVGKICYESLFNRDAVCPWSVMTELKQESCGVQHYDLAHLGKIFQVRSFPIKIPGGTMGKLGHLKDVTETKRLRHKIREFTIRQEAIEDAANLANMGIFIIRDSKGMKGRFLFANEAFCRITGYEEAELLERSLGDLLHPDDFHETLEACERGLNNTQKSYAHEIRMIRKDGAVIVVFFTATGSLCDGDSAVTGFLRDFTKRRKEQQSLLLSQRLASIGKLASEIAHEINNPLTSILTFAKLMKRIVNKDPFPEDRLGQLQNYIALLESETTRCGDIARNLLDFSRQGQIEIKETDIHEVLEKTLSILKHRAKLNEISINTSYAPDVPALLCDFKRLQQVFVNILWNAIESMPEGGSLDVATSYDSLEKVLEISIQDSGCGIPEENIESIFEPFFTTKAEVKGVGLGLSVAYGIVRQHHGDIQVRSSLGKGTQFTIRLPVKKEGEVTAESQGYEEVAVESSIPPISL